MTVREMAMAWLRMHSKDGLKHSSCGGCKLDDLMNCGDGDTSCCVPAKLKNCNECEHFHQHECTLDYVFCMEEAP